MGRPKTTKPPQLPAFRSDADERRFWETYSPSEYLAHMRLVHVEVSRGFLERVKARKRRGGARAKQPCRDLASNRGPSSTPSNARGAPGRSTPPPLRSFARTTEGPKLAGDHRNVLDLGRSAS